MITITRQLAQTFRALMRRARLGKVPSLPDAFVQLIAGSDGLRMRVASSQLAIEYTQPGELPAEELCIPAEVLEFVAGRKAEPVTLERCGQDRVAIQWIDRGVPQLIERAIELPKAGWHWPELPESYTQQSSPDLWSALCEAVATTDRQPTRYALNCLQLRGQRGQIAATDGRHILIQGGFEFPWFEDLLVPGSDLLGARELASNEPVSIGRQGKWVSLAVGAWIISLAIESEARFPKIDDSVPRVDCNNSRLFISPADAEFLDRTLPSLPCSESNNHPVTLDLNGQVVLRGKADDQTRPTELVLSNSRWEGAPLLVNSNRQFLARALQLGFREIHVADNAKPVLCQDERRTFVWALLTPEDSIRSADDAIVTASPAENGHVASLPPPQQPPQPKRRTTVSEPVKVTPPPVTETKSRRSSEPAKRTGSPIEQAIALRDALHDAASAANQLARSLKQQKRQAKLVASTLESLKALQKVAG